MNTPTLPRLLTLLTVLLLSGCAAVPNNVSAPLPTSIALWPAGAPGSEGQTSAEINTVQGQPPDTFPTVTNIHNPSIIPFLPPPGSATGAAVIIAPGGGHQFLAIGHEGYAVAQALSRQGIACFILKYRLAKAKNSPYKIEIHELMDAQRAIRLVRSRAADWGIDPHRVGIMGFSAGGELALLAATRYDHPVPGTHDPVDALDCRPDFQALLYPGGLNDLTRIDINKQTPPAFLACAYNDRITISRNLAQLYLMLKNVSVPAELHIYNSGGHGFGVRPGIKPVNTWTDRFVDWMRDRGLLKAQ